MSSDTILFLSVIIHFHEWPQSPVVNVVVTKSGAWVDVRGIGPERSRLGDSVGPSGFSLYENYSIHFTLKIHPWKHLYYSNMSNYCPCLAEPHFKLKCSRTSI